MSVILKKIFCFFFCVFLWRWEGKKRGGYTTIEGVGLNKNARSNKEKLTTPNTQTHTNL